MRYDRIAKRQHIYEKTKAEKNVCDLEAGNVHC